MRAILIFILAAFSNAIAQTGCLFALIVDDKGSPLANMHTVITRGVSGEYWTPDTDDRGHFKVSGLPAGNYSVVTRNPDLGYPDTNDFDFTDIVHPQRYTVTESGECTEVRVQREPPAGRLQLKLKNGDSGAVIEIPEAQFRRIDGRHGWNATTRYEKELLVPALKPVEVRVGAKGYRTTAPLSIPIMQPGEVRDLTVMLEPIGLGCLQGRVLDAAGQPVAGIRVQPLLINDNVNSKALFINTNKNGEFEMLELPPGVYQVTVHSKEAGYDSFSIVKKDGKFPQVEVPASTACPQVTVNLTEPNAKLMVEVVDAQTKLPVKPFRFIIKSTVPKSWWTSEGRDWNPEIQIPPAKPCSLQVEAEGYEASQPMLLSAFASGEVRKITISLQPAAQIPKQP